MSDTNTKNAVNDYIEKVIKNSWTWGKLTEDEKQRFLNMGVFSMIKGSKNLRLEWMATIYESFLVGIGYNGWEWRSKGGK